MALPNGAASIDALLSQMATMRGQLAGSSFTPPSSYQGYQSQGAAIGNIGYTPANPNGNWNFTAADFPSLVSPKATVPSWAPNLWDALSGTLGQPVGYVTSMLDKAIGIGKKDFSGNAPWYNKLGNFLNDANPAEIIGGTLADGISNGAKKQWSNWTDGKLSWGDIPAVGFLNGMDKGWKRGSDIVGSLGMQDGLGKTAAGIGIDIALDPLTYLTGGLSTASKLKNVAEITKATELAREAGVVGKFKNTNEFLTAAADATRAKYANYPNLVEKMVTKKTSDYADAIKQAGSKAFSDNINKTGMAIPFTNKVAPIANVPKWSPTYRTEATLGSDFSHVATNLLDRANMNNDAAKTIIQKFYGVDSIENLTKSHLSDLTDRLAPVINQFDKGGKIPDVSVVSKIVENVLPKANFDSLMTKFTKDNVPWKDVQKQLDQILQQTAHDPALRSSIGSQLAKMVEDYWATKPAKNFSGATNARKAESMNWASRFLGQSDKYQTVENTVKDIFKNGDPLVTANRDKRAVSNALNDMMNTVTKDGQRVKVMKNYSGMADTSTKFEHFLGRHNPFDARTLKTGNAYVNSMANHIADAGSQKVGNTARYSQALNGIQKFVDKNNISPTDMEHAIYVLENHAPDSLGGVNFKPSDKALALAEKIRPVLDAIGNHDVSAGVLSGLKDNYFPHVINASEETQKAMADFAKRHPELSQLNNLKQGSKFDQVRKSFQTLAERDNYISKLEKAIQKETDPVTIESLRKQLDHVANIFDTNVVSALTRRIKEGVRAGAMKEMQGKLQKFGMMKVNPEDIVSGTKGLTKIDSATAKKLGLNPKDENFVHPQVLDGMKRVDEIFTNQGMNKFVRHLNAISDIWRPLVTFYKISHYRNNFIGNAMINMAAGVSISDYKTAGKLLLGYRKGTLTPEQMKIIDSAYKHNVLSGGFLNDAHATYKFDDPTALEKFAKKVGENKVVKAVRQKGEIVDDYTRLANFVGGMNKYGSTEKAAEQVRKYLFNYNELTNADRGMRTAIPFWNWIKRNVPLQMNLLLENPKFAQNVGRFYSLFNDNTNVPKGKEYLKDSRGYIKIPNSNYFTSLPNPVTDLNTVLNPLSMLGSTNPAAQIPIETYMNKTMFTGKPISYGSPTVQPQDIPAYLASKSGIGGNIYDAVTGKKSIAESLMNLLNPISKIDNKK